MRWYGLPFGLYFHLILTWTLWNEVKGTDYLIAIHLTNITSSDMYATANTGTLQIQYPNYGYKSSWTSSFNIDKKMETTEGVEYKSIVITPSFDSVRILVRLYNTRNYPYYNDYTFSPLPVSALGKRYIVSSCRSSDEYRSFLVIATHGQKADIDITFKGKSSVSYGGRMYRHGDILRLKLGSYQTLTTHSDNDLTGTIINSSETIGLFVGLLFKITSSVVAYDQLLPVKHHGNKYVVAVDDNIALYNMQITSEHSGTNITFNNGNTVTLDNSDVYQKMLQKNEALYFNSSTPVMTTLCRLNGTRSGFAIVPPVSHFYTQYYMYGLQRRMYVLMTENENEIGQISSYSKIDWKQIPNSLYKVGKFMDRSNLRTFNYPFTGAIMSYGSHSIYSSGFANRQSRPVISDTTKYVIAISKSQYNTYLFATGKTGIPFLLQYPHLNQSSLRQTRPYTDDLSSISSNMRVDNGIENKTIIVSVTSDDIQVSVNEVNTVDMVSFLPLPESALDTRYIVSSCFMPYANYSMLVIATANETTDVDITFKLVGEQVVLYGGTVYHDGDTLRVRLQEYQTLTLQSSSSLCGTIVTAKRKVAVFSGTTGNVFYHQLLPVSKYGQEFVAAVDDSSLSFRNSDSIQYHILIVSESPDTQIIFSDETKETVGDKKFHRKSLRRNESIVFKTTQPVTSYLCKYDYGRADAAKPLYFCTTIPPLSLHTKETLIVLLKYQSVIKVSTEKSTADLEVTWYRNKFWPVTQSVEWEDIPNSKYKVGTCLLTGSVGRSVLSINSSRSFTVLGFGYDSYERSGNGAEQYIFNGGYSFGGNYNQTSSATVTKELIVGIACGCVMLVFTIVIIALVIFIRKKFAARSQGNTSHGPSSAHTRADDILPHNETTPTPDKNYAKESSDVGVKGPYPGFDKDNESENEYEDLTTYRNVNVKNVYGVKRT